MPAVKLRTQRTWKTAEVGLGNLGQQVSEVELKWDSKRKVFESLGELLDHRLVLGERERMRLNALVLAADGLVVHFCGLLVEDVRKLVGLYWLD